MKSHSASEPRFVIGAVSRATGIPVETIRVWERRYGAVTPHRDAENKRYYTSAEIEKLKLIRQLADLGHAVGAVASLPEEALREMLAVHGESAEEAGPEQVVEVMVCGEMLPQLVRDWDLSAAPLRVVNSSTSFAEFEGAAVGGSPQILVLELAVLSESALKNLADLASRVAARRAVVLYSYAPEALVAHGRTLGLWMERGPVTREGFEALCRLAAPALGGSDFPATPELADIPPRRYDNGTLARIANISTAVQCECPHHLADLLFRINAFERYSADCQNRNEQDALIHARLRQRAGQARALFEEALAFLIASEGIQLD